MYSREYFYSLRQLSASTNVADELRDKFANIDKLLFKEQFDNWRDNNRPSILKTNLSDDEKIETELNSYLNKLTNKTFDTLSAKILKIYKENDITAFLINSIFDKSILQPFFCPYYVKILKLLEMDMEEKLNEKIEQYLDIIDNNSVSTQTDITYDEFCENNKKKKIKCGYSQFIGELYLNKLLDYSIIMKNLHYFIENLNTILSNEDEMEQLEDNIICLGKLFETVKNAMKPEDKNKLIKYLNVFIRNDKMPKRFKFKLMDLKDAIQ